MNLEKEVLKLTCKLYADETLSRTHVQNFILSISNFIENVYNPFLLEKINSSLQNVIDTQVSSKLKQIFNDNKNPFIKYSSEDKRIRIFENYGLYAAPKLHELDKVKKSKSDGVVISSEDSKVPILVFDLQRSLKQLLELPGLFNETLNYINYLKSEEKVSMNFMQGKLWNKLENNFKSEYLSDYEEGIVILPINGYFDDVETRKATGSHAGKNQIGAVYTHIPCLPPNFVSKLQSILPSCLFFSKDGKNYEEVVFNKFIEQMNSLRKNGIDIVVENKKRYKVYFLFSLMLADNLGCNTLFGLPKSFSSMYYCRMCYVSKEVAQFLAEEDSSLLRIVEKYNEDVKFCDVNKTGIKAPCYLNLIDGYTFVENPSCDSMHDMHEAGVCSCILCNIMLTIINDKKLNINIDYINYMLKTLNFGFESSNLPPEIKLDYLKKNLKLRMSAAESIFFARYFGIIVGDKIPEDYPVWKLYKTLREVISVMTSPVLKKSHISRLEDLIRLLNEQYIEFYGALKPKFHNLVHYKRCIENNGPIVNLSCIRFESFHRIWTNMLKNSTSNTNILTSLGIRYNLYTMNSFFKCYEKYCLSFGSEKKEVCCDAFPNAKSLKSFTSVSINDFTYKIDTIIITGFSDDGPQFGKITEIYLVDKEIFFHYTIIETVGFNSHYFAYSVDITAETDYVSYKLLPERTPCLLFNKKNATLVATRYIL